MFDCANVEMRELLPDLIGGTLDAATRARVDQHVSSCAECASELETLRLVRSAYASAPVVDVRRIVAALPKVTPVTPVTPTAHAGRGGGSLTRWIDWRVAAALTMISVGGLSLAVAHRRSTAVPRRDSAVVGLTVDTAVAHTSRAPATEISPSAGNVQRRLPVRAGRTSPVAPAKAQLAFAGGVDDLDDASIKALLGALDEMDRAPLAPSEEPDPTPVLPVIRPGAK